MDSILRIKEIETAEWELLNNPKYVKYICARTSDHVSKTFIKLGEAVNERDVISSLFSIIYATYRGLYDDPVTRELAVWFRNEMKTQLDKDAFWDNDDPESLLTIEEEELLNKRNLS